MKCFAYPLFLLLLSAPLDDALAVALILSPAPVADSDDEYLLAEHRPRDHQSAGDRRPMTVRPARAACSLPSWGGTTPKRNRVTHPTHPPFHAFQSLQI
ncbi:MAG TPA: hypothetical protein VGF55_17760 [Gemmataceae bacterium]